MAAKRGRGTARGRKMENRERGHSERGFGGSRGARSATSGSHAHIGERSGPGEVPGAGETQSFGPGTAAGRVAGASSEDFPSTRTPGAERDVENHTRGRDDED